MHGRTEYQRQTKLGKANYRGFLLDRNYHLRILWCIQNQAVATFEGVSKPLIIYRLLPSHEGVHSLFARLVRLQQCEHLRDKPAHRRNTLLFSHLWFRVLYHLFYLERRNSATSKYLNYSSVGLVLCRKLQFATFACTMKSMSLSHPVVLIP